MRHAGTIMLSLWLGLAASAMAEDGRNIRTGDEIPTSSYSDQPYIVKTDDGAWLCALTTGAGHEGQSGQHVITLRSTDLGKTWVDRVAVESATGPEASYAVLLKTPYGRVYIFYNHNTDNIRQVKADNPPFTSGFCSRVDSLGHYVFKYSDDHGKTWSDKRYDVPVREMEIDRSNADGGALRYFWNVGRPFVHEGAAYCSLHKVGGFGYGFFTRSEGVLLRSANLLTERDPTKITWETLPEGDFGLRAPAGGGPISEEQSYVVLSDGTFYAVYRTIDGWPAFARSFDNGRTWTEPAYQSYADGHRMKHPRAANFIWKCGNGKYLYWFHNHGGRFVPMLDKAGFEDRNPVWLCGGTEVETPEGRTIRWSQPEILLYDDDPWVRISYPDLVEEDGRYFVTETQKDVARVHEVDPVLLEGLWGQFDASQKPSEGLLLTLQGTEAKPLHTAPMPTLPPFAGHDMARMDMGRKDFRAGITVRVRFALTSAEPGLILFDTRTPDGRGMYLRTGDQQNVVLVLSDGRTQSRWDSDPGTIQPGRTHDVTMIVDGGPKVILFVVDGVLCDGGDHRQFGWGRFSPNLRDCNGDATLRFGSVADQGMEIQAFDLYGRALRVSEAIANWRAFLQ